MQKKKLEHIILALKSKNLHLLSGYVNNKQKVTVVCQSGHTFSSQINYILNGTGCYTCYKTKKALEQELKIQEVVNSTGNKFVKVVDRKKALVEVICKNGHTTNRNFYDIQKLHDCKYCVGNHLNMSEVESFISSTGFSLVEAVDGLVVVKCPNGHSKKMAYKNKLV